MRLQNLSPDSGWMTVLRARMETQGPQADVVLEDKRDIEAFFGKLARE